jgi:hypothetical protein
MPHSRSRVLTDDPGGHDRSAEGFLYVLTESAVLGEPGVMTALIALKLSASAQFADRSGGCARAPTAAPNGADIVKGFALACSHP